MSVFQGSVRTSRASTRARFGTARRLTLAVAIAAACTQFADNAIAREQRVTMRAMSALTHAPRFVEGGSPVTNCNDSGEGSLRDAVAHAANNGFISVGALTCSTITLTTGAIHVGQDSLAIGIPTALAAFDADRTAGDYATVLTIDGGGSDRVFEHSGSQWLALSGLQLQNGSVDGNGGCIESTGNVELRETRLTGCRAHDSDYNHGHGGAVHAAGEIVAFDSRFIKNVADGSAPIGGALFAGGGAHLQYVVVLENTALSSTFKGQGLAGAVYGRDQNYLGYSAIVANDADLVGGADLAIANMIQTTISDNTAQRIGGLLSRYGATLAFCTVTANAASQSDGGVQLGAPSVWTSSIVAGNFANGVPSDVTRANVTGDVEIDGSHDLIIASDVPTPADTLSVDPMLGALATYGSTVLHPLLPGSPAIDAGGDGTKYDYDQRGAPHVRVVGDAADIGAFELAPVIDHIFADDFDPAAPLEPSRIASAHRARHARVSRVAAMTNAELRQ